VEGGGKADKPIGYADANGMEAITAFDCAPGCPVAALDAQSGTSTSRGGSRGDRSGYEDYRLRAQPGVKPGFGDTGGASRFFPCLEWDPERDLPFLYAAKASAKERPRLEDGTAWPTVKPVSVMRWLARLVTPPEGLVLDPFCGTAATGEAAALEGFRCLLIERDPVAAQLATVRLARHAEREARRRSLPVQPDLFGGAA
jgi:hypothetical protein